jgi:predicted amidohydrolase
MGRSDPLGFAVALVQSAFTAADYASAAAFRDKVSRLAARAVDASPRPALIAFPELTGMWLPLLAGTEWRVGDRARRVRSLATLAVFHLTRHPLSALSSLLSGRSLSFAFRIGWRTHLEEWLSPFRDAAVRYGLYVCPGSTFLPRVDRNNTRDWELRDDRVCNTACLINPHGRILCFTRKTRLTAEERRLGISPGCDAETAPVATELGPLGILVCLDGFHEYLVQRMDAAGARVLIQPSANPVAWHAPMGAMDQEEEWLSLGLGSLIQGRENVRCSLNPMSVSRILGHDDEGRSSVFVNREAAMQGASGGAATGTGAEDAEAGRYPGLAAIASSYDREEIVRASL